MTDHRKDANHDDVTRWLEEAGWTVVNNSQAGEGHPDIWASQDGIVVACEVKPPGRPSRQRLSEKQARFALSWDGPYRVLVTEQHCKALGELLSGEFRRYLNEQEVERYGIKGQK